MKRSSRMQPVAGLADQKQQQAAQIYAQAQQALAAAEQQLQQLLTYRDEYSQQMGVQSGVSMERLRNFQTFVQQLGHAIKQAERDIESHKKMCEHRRQQWLKTRARSQALHKVVEKYEIEERIEEARKEQKNMDEHAQRIGARRDDS